MRIKVIVITSNLVSWREKVGNLKACHQHKSENLKYFIEQHFDSSSEKTSAFCLFPPHAQSNLKKSHFSETEYHYQHLKYSEFFSFHSFSPFTMNCLIKTECRCRSGCHVLDYITESSNIHRQEKKHMNEQFVDSFKMVTVGMKSVWAHYAAVSASDHQLNAWNSH